MMSETFEVQFLTCAGEWLPIQRSGIGQTKGTSRFPNVTDAFILLGNEMKCDPDMEHRIVRFVEEVVIHPTVGDKS